MIADRYGQQWTRDLLRTWFGGQQPAWAYGGGQERPQWVADWLPGLCEALHAMGSAGTVAAQHLLDLAWEWTGKDIGTGLASSSPGYRDKELGDLGKPLASVLKAAAAIGAASRRDTVSGYIRKQGDAVTVLEMSALRAAAELPPDGTRGEAGFGDLAADCVARLRARLARPQRASGDWSIKLPSGGCACDLCGTLRVFTEDKGRLLCCHWAGLLLFWRCGNGLGLLASSPEALLGALFSESVARADLVPGGTGLAGGLNLGGLQFLCRFSQLPGSFEPANRSVGDVESAERRGDPPDGIPGGHHHSVSTTGTGQ